MFNGVPGHCCRPGCQFRRNVVKTPTGALKELSACSLACSVWTRRAKRAAKGMHANSGEEARELLRLSGLLDARSRPTEHVPGLKSLRAS
jgi:hypothetical protein